LQKIQTFQQPYLQIPKEKGFQKKILPAVDCSGLSYKILDDCVAKDPISADEYRKLLPAQF
jgi:hypothetical protein